MVGQHTVQRIQAARQLRPKRLKHFGNYFLNQKGLGFLLATKMGLPKKHDVQGVDHLQRCWA